MSINTSELKLAILLGGTSSEREISILTGEAVLTAIAPYFSTSRILLESDLQNVMPQLQAADVIFNALHGGAGENGSIQAMLDESGLIYTGSGPEASQLAMDKHRSKLLAQKQGVSTPEWLMLDRDVIEDGPPDIKALEYPVVVKPNGEGSTVGLTIVESPDQLTQALLLAADFDNQVLIEQYIPGRELTVGILGETALPIVEITPTHQLYDYECKYTPGMSAYRCPANLPLQLSDKLRDDALEMHRSLGCRHYSRVDFRLNSRGNHFFLEVNTLPGMTGTSLLPKAAKAAGLDYPQLIDRIIHLALEK